MDFKNKDDMPTTVVTIGAVVAILAAGLFVAVGPKPVRTYTDAKAKADQGKTMLLIESTKKEIAAAKATISQQSWPGMPEEILPLALDKVTKMAFTHHLKLVGFHPQKSIDTPSISLIPCVVNVDGQFTNIVAFERDIETPGTNLAVNLMQLSTADQETNKVTASIGIIAYQVAADTAKDASTDTSNDSTKDKKGKSTSAGGKKNA